jgi:hypothetical protein
MKKYEVYYIMTSFRVSIKSNVSEIFDTYQSKEDILENKRKELNASKFIRIGEELINTDYIVCVNIREVQ